MVIACDLRVMRSQCLVHMGLVVVVDGIALCLCYLTARSLIATHLSSSDVVQNYHHHRSA